MANHPSALKRHRQSERRRLRNQAVRSRLKTELKKFESHLTRGEKEKVLEELRLLKKLYQRAATKGILHGNRARRLISRITLKAQEKLGPLPV